MANASTLGREVAVAVRLLTSTVERAIEVLTA